MKTLLMMPKILFDTWPVANNALGNVVSPPGCTLPILAASMGDRSCTLFDGLNQSISLKDYRDLINAHELIGMNVVSPLTSLDTEITVKLIRKINPKAKIVLGGHHATFYDREWIEKGADVVVRGEGEVTFPEVLTALENGSSLQGIPGISYAKDAAVEKNPDRPFLKNLDDVPFPKWELIDLCRYDLHLRKDGGAAGSLETARGCTHRCKFCTGSAMWNYTQRFKSVDRILDETQYLKDIGVKQIAIIDDNFGTNAQRCEAFFQGLLDRKVNLPFWSFYRVDLALENPGLVALAASAGLRAVYVGYEHIVPEINKRYRKGFKESYSFETFKQAYGLFRRHGIFVFGLFVHHYDFETAEEKRSVPFCRQICDITSPKKFTPMVGTPAYREMLEEGRKLKDTFYHEQFSPSYIKEGRPQENLSFLTSFRNLFNMKIFAYGLAGAEHEKSMVRAFYRGLFSGVLRTNPRKILNYLESMLNQKNPEVRQEKLREYYLSERFLEKLKKRKFYYWG